MTRTAAGLCAAATMAWAVSLGAQTSTTTAQRSGTTTDKAHDVTVTGCLARGAEGSFMLNNARMDTGTSSTTTGTAGSTTTAGGAATSAPGSAMPNTPAMNWTLMGGSDLDKHVGHKVQITGKTSWDSTMSHGSTTTAAAGTAATTTGTTGTAEEQRKGDAHGAEPRLDVQSVKMISSSCS